MDSTQQQLQVVGTSWLSRGVASPGNLLLLLATFVLFPIIGRVRMYGEQRLSPTPSVSQAARKHTDFFRSLTAD